MLTNIQYIRNLSRGITIPGIALLLSCAPGPAIKKDAARVIRYEDVANFTYDFNPVFDSGASLKAGTSRSESGIFRSVELTGHVGQGDYRNGEPFAVPVLKADAGDFGVFYLMCLVDSVDGYLRQRDCALLGDRVEVRRLDIQGDLAVLNLIQHASGDSLGNPTDTTSKILYISGAGLSEDQVSRRDES